jgi:hypothetical protein
LTVLLVVMGFGLLRWRSGPALLGHHRTAAQPPYAFA